MGFYKRFVGSAQSLNKQSDVELSDKLLTPPTLMTGTRVPLALKAAHKLLHGEKYAAPYVAAMAGSDAEGILARFIDKRWPESGLGCTEAGVKLDVLADAAGVLIVAGAVLAAPRTTKTAKLAVAATIGQEAAKMAWFMHANNDFKAARAEHGLTSENLVLPIDLAGKEAMVEKFGAVFFAAATNDFESPAMRTTLSGLAVAHSISGSLRGEHVRQGYAHQLEDVIGEMALAPSATA